MTTWNVNPETPLDEPWSRWLPHKAKDLHRL